tara:strand:- start:1924 stop:2142 length:219 start_codon:yes stop_codon:yes gene_type:complete
VSSKDKGGELSKEDVQKKVDKMYENYGIDPHGSEDGDLARVYRFYVDNPHQLDVDFNKSKEHADKFAEEDAL